MSFIAIGLIRAVVVGRDLKTRGPWSWQGFMQTKILFL
jgi:hypothetical protein